MPFIVYDKNGEVLAICSTLSDAQDVQNENSQLNPTIEQVVPIEKLMKKFKEDYDKSLQDESGEGGS